MTESYSYRSTCSSGYYSDFPISTFATHTTTTYTATEPPCSSCGEFHTITSFDRRGRCPVSVEIFWGKVRKLYWYRRYKLKDNI